MYVKSKQHCKYYSGEVIFPSPILVLLTVILKMILEET